MPLQSCHSWLLLWRPLETAVQAISWRCSPIKNKVSLSVLIFSYLSLVISVYTVVRYSFIKANLLAISFKVNNPQEAVHLNLIQRGCLAGILCASVQGGINAMYGWNVVPASDVFETVQARFWTCSIAALPYGECRSVMAQQVTFEVLDCIVDCIVSWWRAWKFDGVLELVTVIGNLGNC